jgi:hypothetical protein
LALPNTRDGNPISTQNSKTTGVLLKVTEYI